jgi:SAM-dependent methyltransferase
MNDARTFRCWSCGGNHLAPVLDLGRTPLANSLVKPEDATTIDPVFPLELRFCQSCALVQITESVPPEALFREYLYFSSFSDTMLRHSKTLVDRMVRERGLTPQHLVVEVASNDGYLLQYYRDAGVQVLGVEPAVNIAKVAQEKGIPTVADFFGDALAQGLRADGRRAAVMHANNVLAHVPDLNGFVRGFKTLLADDGVAIFEAPYVRDMIEGLEFDTIYHEHLCYYSLTALDALFRRNGMSVVRVERVPIHGGSIRVFTSHAGMPVDDTVTAMLADEHALGMDSLAYYEQFARRVWDLKKVLTGLLADLKRGGARVVAYGASAKGSTLLNAFGIGADLIDFVVDRSTYKQGKLTPGTHLEIRDPSVLIETKPDYALLLTWNFAAEILEQQKAYREGGGRFIVPVPDVRVM